MTIAEKIIRAKNDYDAVYEAGKQAGSGSDPVIESLEITSNGTYTATNCDGYSPITVNVPQDGAPTAEELVVTGSVSHRFASNGWNWFLAKYGNQMITKDITNCQNMFAYSGTLEEVPFQINVTDCSSFGYMFSGCDKLKDSPVIRGTIKWSTGTTFNDFGAFKYSRNIDNVFTPEMMDGFSTVKITGAYSSAKPVLLARYSSLRKVPDWWYKFRLNPESTVYPSYTNCLYYLLFQQCSVLDEITNIPVWKCKGAQTSNMFNNFCSDANRLKTVTFETNPDGSPIVTEWKAQVIDLSNATGWATTENSIIVYNSGIRYDKLVDSDAKYEELKNDTDWYTTKTAWSRYNHDSAVETINSLPDTSAYLATAGGTNTIKFKGVAGSSTDSGAINTLTEEEIAVATAKGWTVTLA